MRAPPTQIRVHIILIADAHDSSIRQTTKWHTGMLKCETMCSRVLYTDV